MSEIQQIVASNMRISRSLDAVSIYNEADQLVNSNGHNKTGKQVYRCNNPECRHYSFVEEYT